MNKGHFGRNRIFLERAYKNEKSIVIATPA
jgi:hypothetical protein